MGMSNIEQGMMKVKGFCLFSFMRQMTEVGQDKMWIFRRALGAGRMALGGLKS